MPPIYHIYMIYSQGPKCVPYYRMCSLTIECVLFHLSIMST